VTRRPTAARASNVRPEVRRSAALGILLALSAAPAEAAPTRYSLANGCYRIEGLPNAERVRMQASALGRYLLYRPDGTYVTARGVAEAPAEWRVERARGGRFTLTERDARATVRFVRTTGCAVFPEAELNATGTPSKGAVPFGTVGGAVDGHMHWMTFEYLGGRFHCGRPWHRYGIAHALPDCATVEGPAGSAAPLQNLLNYGTPVHPHDTRGYPQLTEFKSTNLTYEGTYWRWIERAWMAGLRLMVMSINENRVLCELQANRQTDCDEMATVRRGLDDMEELQRYVDAQAGGPGKGFFQIVTTPYAARRVINAGKLAVVLEIEISEPFGCRGWDAPTCDTAKVDRELDDLHRRGVRSALLLNKFDNPLAGVRFDSGSQGAIVNSGNVLSAGSFWSAETCKGPLRDNTIATAAPLPLPGVPVATPVYPPPPHCNTRGLTDLGRHVVERLMDRRMIVNPDHMSQAAVDATLTLLEARGYSGVISPHGWMDPGNWPRLWQLGGLAFPGHSNADQYVREWAAYRPRQTPYAFGWGYGADLGGLSVQPGPGALTYPFKALDPNVTFERQRTGERTFDYATQGVAHYGLYADWLADLRRLGGDALANDMWAGAEAYLQMWERADGVPAGGCRPAGRFRGLGLGSTWRSLLRRAGQPQQRTRAWAWCVQGGGNDVAVLDRNGRVELVGTTAPSVVGAPMSGTGIQIRGRRVYDVRGGRVAAVGIATRKLSRAGMRAAMRRLRNAKAGQAPRAFVPNETPPPTGRALAASGVPATDAALTLLCGLLSR
jgi:microsomal dipeptidase-like Zn-dependent dipeptidase